MGMNYNFDKDVKGIICKNMKIARKLAQIRLEEAAEIFDVSNEHLKRIEAKNDRNSISLILFYKATKVYQQPADFFFQDPTENEKLLKHLNK
ncbi:MAG: helix-turn-helix transcriptional regulator [Bacilli bacterium]|nr:helix-turn-helix transcriptional regulator [Bacilli bacterium]